MHIAFGVAPSRLCSRTSRPRSRLPSLPSLTSLSVGIHPIARAYMRACVCVYAYVSPYRSRCHPFAANVNSFCHALNGAKLRFSPPSLVSRSVATQLRHFYLSMSISTSPSRAFSLSLSFSFTRFKRYLCHINRISPLYAPAYAQEHRPPFLLRTAHPSHPPALRRL